jgi:hypothetical protein
VTIPTPVWWVKALPITIEERPLEQALLLIFETKRTEEAVESFLEEFAY